MFALRSSSALARPAFGPASAFASGSRFISLSTCRRPQPLSPLAVQPAAVSRPLTAGLATLKQRERSFSTQSAVSDKSLPETVGEGAFERLTWEGYLAKRKYRKRAELLVAIPTTFLGLFLGIAYMQSLEVDPTTPIAGIEPVYFYILATVGSGVAGYMVGPPLGAAAWRFYNRKWAKALQEMDTRFYDHVKRNRADPAKQTLSSSAHPLPDYYGEKIDSLSAYRKWLRAQNKYKRTSV